MSKQNPLIIVAMSGGVDSSVAALLLKEQGYQLEGIFMKNWEEDDTDNYCAASQDVADAQAICDQLEIKLHRVNFAAEYWENVFENFLHEYQLGRTPNPDILCNKEIKFKALMNYAMQLGADYIATGHYARIHQANGEHQLRVGHDNTKDQSYFLYTLGQSQLKRSLFPIGEFTKKRVREIAQQHGFINSAKKDSTGICFIGEKKFKDFLSRYISPKQVGNMETPQGTVVGKHDGLMFYTIGQRQGLGLGGMENALEAPWYVVGKDIQRNVLIIAQGQNHPRLYASALTCTQLHWISEQNPELPLQCQAKIRYRQTAQACWINKVADDTYRVEFTHPQRAITPGQAIVFYSDEICLGGATIKE